MVKYKLVNPHIKGSIKVTFNAKSSDDAAQKAWNKLTKYITTHVPKFAFTLESDKNKLHHFIVKEKVTDDVIDTEISELPPIKNNKKFIAHFRKQKKKFDDKISGGSYLDCDDDDDDEYSFPIYPFMSQKISYLWYYPLMYRLGNTFIPVFTPQISPMIYLDYPLFIYK
uniref:Uncharacterized protein n=1 Tax=Mimivirus LCMiAC02 TaxID=2506609 RepID=A0A4D5XG07_9VIRU|nr:MAG: uncharacterized protein LCMiAC02_04560 [Mimivirus LCMiAC02]